MNRLLCLLCTSILLAGCPKKPAETPKPLDADANSGPDAKRSGAASIPLNQGVTDDVTFDKQDQTDWKSIDLKGQPGVLNVELHWDNASSDLAIDVFDSFGTQIGSSPGGNAGSQMKKVAVQIDNLGTYYLRIQAPKAGEGSVYTIEAKWDVGEPAEKEEKRDKPKPKAQKHEKKWNGEGGVQGRIVSSYREKEWLILHLDKGAAARIQVGQKGTVLEGTSGETPLVGGTFEITQVIDDSRSIARTTLRSIGRNIRVAINTGK